MKRHDIAALERALLEYVAFYGLSDRARDLLGRDLPTTFASEQAWAVRRLQALREEEATGRQPVNAATVAHPLRALPAQSIWSAAEAL